MKGKNLKNMFFQTAIIFAFLLSAFVIKVLFTSRLGLLPSVVFLAIFLIIAIILQLVYLGIKIIIKKKE